MLQYTLSLVTVAAGVYFLFSVFRAARFAQRQKDQLQGITERTTWWIRLFAKNGYGPAVEQQRRVLALQWLMSAAIFFALAAANLILAQPN